MRRMRRKRRDQVAGVANWDHSCVAFLWKQRWWQFFSFYVINKSIRNAQVSLNGGMNEGSNSKTLKTNTHTLTSCWWCVDSGSAACQQVSLITDQLCRTNLNVLTQLFHGDVWTARRGEWKGSNQAADVSSILPRKWVFRQTQHLNTSVWRKRSASCSGR